MHSNALVTWIVSLFTLIATVPAAAQNQDLDRCAASPVNLDATIEACTQALKSDLSEWQRRSALALSLRAWAWKAKGDPGRADADFTAAIRVDPSFAPPFEGRGNLYRDAKQCGRAISDYNEAIRLRPERVQNYLSRGLCLVAQGDLEHPLADLDQAIKLDEKNAGGYAIPAWTTKAVIHARKGDLDQAISDYDEAIRLDSSRAALYLERGSIWNAKGIVEKALADYNRTIKLDPKNALAYNTRGDFFRNRGEYDKAIADYDKAAENRPDDITAYGNRGLARFYAGAYAKSADDLRRVVTAQPNLYSTLWLFLAAAQSNRRDARDELAKADAQLKISDWPHPIVELFLGKKSASEAEAAAGNDDQRCEAKFYVGEWQLMNKNRKDAVKALQAALDSCPKGLAEYQGAATQMKLLN